MRFKLKKGVSYREKENWISNQKKKKKGLFQIYPGRVMRDRHSSKKFNIKKKLNKILKYVMENHRNLFSQCHLNKPIITIIFLCYTEVFITFIVRFKYNDLHSYLTRQNKVFKLHSSLILVVKKNTLSAATVEAT